MAVIRTNTTVVDIIATHDDISGFLVDLAKKSIMINLVHGNFVDNVFKPIYTSKIEIQDTIAKTMSGSEHLVVDANNKITLSNTPDLNEDFEIVYNEGLITYSNISDKEVTLNVDDFDSDPEGFTIFAIYYYTIPAFTPWEDAALTEVITGETLYASLKRTLWKLLIDNGYVAGEIV
jgi:hypothetical protein